MTMKSFNDIALTDVHYCSFTSQSNVYGLSHVITENNDVLILASTHSKVMCLSYQKQGNELISSYKELHFPYIPGDADIISIDSYTNLHSNSVSIGITFVKLGDDQMSKFFNVYPEWQVSRGDGMPHRSSFVLQYSPLHLYHTDIPSNTAGNWDVVWLLSGSDGKVHVYEEKSRHVVCEQPTESAFPELSNLPTCALWLNIHNMKDAAATPSRMTAVGCNDGVVLVSKVVSPCWSRDTPPDIKASWSVKLDSPITVLRFFTTPVALSDTKYPSSLQLSVRDSDDDSDISSGTAASSIEKQASPPITAPRHLGLIVTSAIEETLVFSDVDTYCHGSRGPDYKRVVLPESSKYDCVLCCCLADIDLDGYDEILLGTYGQQILIYKESVRGSTVDPIEDAVVGPPRYTLASRLPLSEPVLALLHADVTRDGVRELLALGLRGLHVLRHDPAGVAALLRVRLHQLRALAPRRDAFHDLQDECLDPEQAEQTGDGQHNNKLMTEASKP